MACQAKRTSAAKVVEPTAVQQCYGGMAGAAMPDSANSWNVCHAEGVERTNARRNDRC
jgi:hypothetical protein